MQYLSIKSIAKENLKDLYYGYKLKKVPNEYVFIHIPKCGGTTLRKNLNINLNAYIYDWHEIKLKHLNNNQKAIVCIRDPIKRFESAFYSKLHMKKNLNYEEKLFYEKFNNINKFINALINDSENLISYLKKIKSIPMITRYSSLRYWFGTNNDFEKNKKKIKYVIKLEELENDLCSLYRSEKINHQPLAKELNTKPKNKFETIDQKYFCFLNQYLDEEFNIANKILTDHNKIPYTKY